MGWLAWMPFALLLALGGASRWTPVFPAPLVSGSGLALGVAPVGLLAWVALRWAGTAREED